MGTDLVMSVRFFQCSYLYTEMITIYFGGEAGHSGGGGSFYPSNTLDRTLFCDGKVTLLARGLGN